MGYINTLGNEGHELLHKLTSDPVESTETLIRKILRDSYEAATRPVNSLLFKNLGIHSFMFSGRNGRYENQDSETRVDGEYAGTLWHRTIHVKETGHGEDEYKLVLTHLPSESCIVINEIDAIEEGIKHIELRDFGTYGRLNEKTGEVEHFGEYWMRAYVWYENCRSMSRSYLMQIGKDEVEIQEGPEKTTRILDDIVPG